MRQLENLKFDYFGLVVQNNQGLPQFPEKLAVNQNAIILIANYVYWTRARGIIHHFFRKTA
jgi:hypothetical protein